MSQNEIDEVYNREWVEKRYGPGVKTRDYIDVMVKSIVRDLCVTTVLDLGCGACNFANTFKMYGCADVVAVDGSSFAADAARSDVAFIHHDLREYCIVDLREDEHAHLISTHFELVFCVETIEHIEAEYEDIVLDNIVRHAGKWIVFTGAPPGQDGIEHVNCRPKEYWAGKFDALGFEVIPSEALEGEWRKKKVRFWYVDNLLILRKRQ